MPVRQTPNIDWEPWDPRIHEFFAKGWPVKTIWERLCTEGMEVKYSTFTNHVIVRLKLYRKGAYGPRTELMGPKMARKIASGRAAGWRELGLMDDEPKEERLCQRPTLGRVRSLTAHLMGDPLPGRTPWAVEPTGA